MIVGRGELEDFIQTFLHLRLVHGIRTDELESMVPYQYELFLMMFKKHMQDEAERNKR